MKRPTEAMPKENWDTQVGRELLKIPTEDAKGRWKYMTLSGAHQAR